MIRKPQHLAIANTSFICILGLLNGGAMAINLQLEYSLPILPIIFFLSALFSMIFWMYCANKLTLEPEKQKKAALLAAMPWWILSAPAFIASIIFTITTSEASKAIGWGILTILLLTAGVLCWAVHLVIIKTQTKINK
ncbi:MAG: hypothetical protein VYC62_03355 [Verrucomicrobiota bacterium]|nr:hypothetical protein [Verrucomicrobiota bacterium]